MKRCPIQGRVEERMVQSLISRSVAWKVAILLSLLPGVSSFLRHSLLIRAPEHTRRVVHESSSVRGSGPTEVSIEGQILSQKEFERRSQLDAVIQALRVQLPLTLTKPLTTVSSQAIFTSNVKLTVLVEQDEIDLLNSREELIALSDVLVLGTSTAQQANSVLAFGGVITNSTTINCQILLDSSCQSLIVPWEAKVPGFPGTSSLQRSPGLDTFEGLSEFILNAEGKIERHRLLKVSWNGQAVNGPAIGQTLRALQSTVTNLQNSPLFRSLVGSSNNNGNSNIWTDMRDGLLEQAATAASSRSGPATSQPKPVVLPVASTENVTGFLQISNSTNKRPILPLPGTEEWKDYAEAHGILVEFCEQVVPLLSSWSNVEQITRCFDQNAILTSTQGSQLLQGQDAIANFFQSLSLARRGTGGTWRMQRAMVLDWRKRTVAIDYTATNTPWTISGQDVYRLATATTGRPMVQEIRQTEISVTTPDGSVTLDGPWLMKNLASAVERSSSSTATTSGPNIRDLLTDLLFQQQQLQLGSKAVTTDKKRTVSQTAAANIFYFMSELHNSIPNLWNTTTASPLPPGAEYLDDMVELRGYLGETLLRGSTLYTRAMGTLIGTTRQALSQKRLVLDRSKKVPPPRVELTSTGKVRVTLEVAFRVPPPGGSIFPDAAAVPLALEIVSVYTLDSQTGLVTRHQLVETRVNGQLTPGDVLSRNLQRFLNLEQEDSPRARNNDDLLKSVSDAMAWLRTFSSNVDK